MSMMETSIHLAEDDTLTVEALSGGKPGHESYWIQIGIWNKKEMFWRAVPNTRITLFCQSEEHQRKMLVRLSDMIAPDDICSDCGVGAGEHADDCERVS